MKSSDHEEWQRKDALIGLLVIAAGLVITAFVGLLFSNLSELDQLAVISLVALFIVGIGGILLGPLLVFLGGSTIFQALRVTGDKE